MEPGRVLSGRYELEHEIGSGGAAVVWRARDRILDRTVAVKLLHPAVERDEANLARFRREARSAATLNHGNAVAIYDIGTDGDETFIVMEHVDGPGLDDILDGRPLSPDVALALGFQVASALGAAHAQGLIHRDIKPANILLSPEGQAKLADFGIAKAVDARHTTLTRVGSVVGTVAYLAPEQIRDEPVDARADVYALGLVLHEALTGEPPFGRGTPTEVMARRLATDPPSLHELRPDVPRELTTAVARATRLDPDARFADGRELASHLEALLREEPEVLIRRLAAGDAYSEHRHDDTQVLTGFTAEHETIAISPRPEGPPPRDELAPDEGRPDRADRPVHGDVEDRATDEDRGSAPLVPPEARRPVVALLAGAVLVIAAWSFLGGQGGPGEGGSPDGGGEADEPQAVEVTAARDFDPFGDGEEHREDTAKAYDGDPATAWVTERYDSADLGGLKPGVGLWFDLGTSHDVARIELTISPGTGFEVRIGDAAPEGTDPEAWGTQVDAASGSGETASINVPEDVQGRYVLVWITSVAGAGERAELAEARFLAR